MPGWCVSECVVSDPQLLCLASRHNLCCSVVRCCCHETKSLRGKIGRYSAHSSAAKQYDCSTRQGSSSRRIMMMILIKTQSHTSSQSQSTVDAFALLHHQSHQQEPDWTASAILSLISTTRATLIPWHTDSDLIVLCYRCGAACQACPLAA